MLFDALHRYRFLFLCIGIFLVLSPLFSIKVRYHEKILPGIFIDGVDVGRLTKAEASAKVTQFHQGEEKAVVTLTVDDIKVSTPAADLGIKREIDPTVETAYQFGRKNFFMEGLMRIVFPEKSPKHLSTAVSFQDEALSTFMGQLKEKVDTKNYLPRAELVYSGSPNSLKIFPGTPGRFVDPEQTAQKLVNTVNAANTKHLQESDLTLVAHVASTSSQLNEEQVKAATERAKKLVGKQLIFRADNKVDHLTDQELVELLSFPAGYMQSEVKEVLLSWKKTIDRPAQDAILEYDTRTLKVEKFQPPRDGLALNSNEAEKLLTSNLEKLENSEEKTIEEKLPITQTAPNKKLGDTNNIGIKERIGFGESQYDHSIPNRIHNVALTSSRITNTIVKPGEEFSFNKTLGDVSSATGFKSAYVIRNGKTELGDGGGVCQVSTTVFRSVLNAGLPVTKRKAHSYRVSYYELNSKPGVDATVYSGEVDLRFINDTGQHLLIHSETDSEKLYMSVEIFGTSDGRTAEIVDHKVWDHRGAPAPLYIDDPTIPKGRVRQIDFAASGVKASFKNIVKDKNGNVIREEEYYSNYVPWRAVFLRGV